MKLVIISFLIGLGSFAYPDISEKEAFFIAKDFVETINDKIISSWDEAIPKNPVLYYNQQLKLGVWCFEVINEDKNLGFLMISKDGFIQEFSTFLPPHRQRIKALRKRAEGCINKEQSLGAPRFLWLGISLYLIQFPVMTDNKETGKITIDMRTNEVVDSRLSTLLVRSRDSGFGIRGSGFGVRDSEVKSQESGVKSRESGVRSQESGVGSQESGVGSQESRVKSQESGVKSQESGVRSQETQNSKLLRDTSYSKTQNLKLKGLKIIEYKITNLPTYKLYISDITTDISSILFYYQKKGILDLKMGFKEIADRFSKAGCDCEPVKTTKRFLKYYGYEGEGKISPYLFEDCKNEIDKERLAILFIEASGIKHSLLASGYLKTDIGDYLFLNDQLSKEGVGNFSNGLSFYYIEQDRYSKLDLMTLKIMTKG